MSETKPNYVTRGEFDESIKEFEESIKKLERKIKKESALPKVPREPNSYNKFLSEKIGEVKAANPKLTNKEAFTECARLWNVGKETAKAAKAEKPIT